jgi:predicted NUDIX family phosphoesterase
MFDGPRFVCDGASIDELLGRIDREGRFLERSVAEQTEEVKQIVACGVIHRGDKVLCIRRTATSDREALRLRYTVLFGGHVEHADRGSAHPVQDCLVRELREELGIRHRGVPRPIGIAVDPTTPVGRLHLGVVFDVPIDSDSVMVRGGHDTSEFANARRSTSHELLTVEAVAAKALDPWSELFLSSAAAARVLGSAAPRQWELNLGPGA